MSSNVDIILSIIGCIALAISMTILWVVIRAARKNIRQICADSTLLDVALSTVVMDSVIEQGKASTGFRAVSGNAYAAALSFTDATTDSFGNTHPIIQEFHSSTNNIYNDADTSTTYRIDRDDNCRGLIEAYAKIIYDASQDINDIIYRALFYKEGYTPAQLILYTTKQGEVGSQVSHDCNRIFACYTHCYAVEVVLCPGVRLCVPRISVGENIE